MLTNITGDILTDAPTDGTSLTIVCHQVNCKGKMGSGLARQIRTKHPKVFRYYAEKCKAGFAKPGDVQLLSYLASSGYMIANIFGQAGYGHDRCYTDYEALKKAFEYLAHGFPNATFRFPYKFGCGLAGGNWDIVLGLIEKCFANCNVEIWRLP